MIDIERLEKMLGALPFALDANLPDDARGELSAAFAELIECRQRIAAAVAECETLAETSTPEPAGSIDEHETQILCEGMSLGAKRIRAKLEGR